jgi:hypothetical protein
MAEQVHGAEHTAGGRAAGGRAGGRAAGGGRRRRAAPTDGRLQGGSRWLANPLVLCIAPHSGSVLGFACVRPISAKRNLASR